MCFVLVGLCPHCGHMAALRTRYCDVVARRAWEPPNPCSAGVNEYELAPGRACGRGCGGGGGSGGESDGNRRARRGRGRYGSRRSGSGVGVEGEGEGVVVEHEEVDEDVEGAREVEEQAERLEEVPEECAAPGGGGGGGGGMLLKEPWEGLDAGLDLGMVQESGDAELRDEFAALMDWYRGEFAEQYVFEWQLGNGTGVGEIEGAGGLLESQPVL